MTTQAVEVNFYTRSGKTLTLFNADVDDSDTDGEEILSGGNGLNVPTGTSLGQYGQGRNHHARTRASIRRFISSYASALEPNPTDDVKIIQPPFR